MKNTNTKPREPKAWFKITGRHMKINAPEGRVIRFWLGAPSRELALRRCEKLQIIDIQSCEEDTGFKERLG